MNTFDIITKHDNITKILYKDFIKKFHHPENRDIREIEVCAMNVFEAYLEIIGEKYISFGNIYTDTQNCRYYLLTQNDKHKFDILYKEIKGTKRKCQIVLMLAGEFVDLNMAEEMKTVKFSKLFNNMTEDKLVHNGMDIKWLRKNKFFE